MSYHPIIDRVRGMGADPAPAQPSFWSSLGGVFVDLTKTYAGPAIQTGLYGQAPAVIRDPASGQVIGGGQTIMSQLPSWFWPVAIIGVGAIAFVILRKR